MRYLLGLLAVLAGFVVAAVPAQAAFPGKNGGIAFAQRATSGDLDPQLVEHTRLLVDPPGSRDDIILLACQTTEGAPTGGDCTGTNYTNLSYSPDGTRIVFDAGARLAVIGSSGGQITLLPATTSDDGDPCFSADGKRIAFTGVNDRGGTDVHTRSLDAGGARLIVHDAGEPAWSSRNRLAYVRSGNVYSSNTSGGDRRWISSGVSPDWSPNGRRLFLVRPLPQLTFDGPNGRLYVLEADGSGIHQVGRSTNISHPIWSPDARYVAYDGFDLGVHRKRLRTGAHPTEVAPTQISGESGSISSFSPAWRPRLPVVQH